MKVFRPSPSAMRWFIPGLYIKRWLLLMFASIVMISLAVGYVLRDIYSSDVRFPPWVQTITLQFLPRAVRATLFAVAGIGILLLCFYKLGQSLLGPFLRAGGNASGATSSSTSTPTASLPRDRGSWRSAAAPA